MKNYSKSELNEEIRSLTQLIQTLESEGLLNPDEDIQKDIRTIEAKRDGFADLRSLLAESNLSNTSELYQKTLNPKDKKHFIRLVRVILWFRRLFKFWRY